MITNEAKVNALTDAAMTIFKFYEKGKGFYSGIKYEEETGKKISVYNSWPAGLRRILENKLGRGLDKWEQTVVSLAIGAGPTPTLTKPERKYSMEFLWDSEYPNNELLYCQDLMKVLTSF